jgi:hypothetical protein
MKKIILSSIIILTSFNLSAQDNSKWSNYIEEVKFPFYLDLMAGASVTSFSNLDGLFGNNAISLGVPINRNFAVGIDYMNGTSGSAHFIKRYSGFGLQTRYVNRRILGNVTIGKVTNAGVNGDLIAHYDYVDNMDFYGRIGVAYRFWKFCSVGISAYTATSLRHNVYDYNEITERYDVLVSVSNMQVGGVAITFGMQLFPPYITRNR